MQKYICKCGKTFEKSTNAATTGYTINNYTPEHECYGCPYIVTERDWITKEIVKRECRATPKITYLTRCCIGTEKGDFSSCKLYSLDLFFVERVLNYINTLEGAEAPTEFINRIPDTWRASDFGQCYALDDCFGLAVFELGFKKNKKGTEARRLVKERFFYDNGTRRGTTEESEQETVLMRIQIAKENAGNKTVINENKKTEENNNMGKFDINTLISQDEQLKQIALDLLIPYHNHKFKLYDGERLEDMVNSIKANGVLTPIIVRPAPNDEGKYEILAGHNRCNAARQAGLNTVPGIVKEKLSDEEAEIYVIETNVIQRGFNDLALSERAAVVAMRHSQMFDPQKRREIQWELKAIERMEDEPEKKSKLALTGEEYSLSKNTVARFIRINKLLQTCEDYTLSVDTANLSVRAAVELSYITSKAALKAVFEKYKDGILIDNLWQDVVKINADKALWLREIFDGFGGNKEQAEKLLDERHRENTKDGIERTAAKPIKISIPSDTFRKYFTEETKPDEAADIIDKALEMYFKAEKEG